ncbi:hypothetical protein [Planobispora takensis]|uniref:Uncharacterized protein n=1 Tax=Planobispora takensis TaxID=1367882 RepID=A0A8J3SYH3_9ACTN|nr:hypothetical protein [Planobispora takensis]GII00615.1 hypothetical protein Pta02_26230 [Planobispora takensis]
MGLLYSHYSLPGGPEHKDETTLSFTSPSHGDTFDFSVTVKLSRVPGSKRKNLSLWSLSPERKEQLREAVRRSVRSTTRRHSIFDLDAAEQEVNTCLDHEMSDPDPLLPGWRADAELTLPEEVKEARRRHLREMFTIEAEAEEVERRMRALHDSRVACERFLSEAMESGWMARYALKLGAAPQNAAAVFESMIDDRHKSARDLLDLLAKIISTQTSANVYDMVLTSESALRQSFDRLGLPLPPPDPDSLFAPVEENV